mmetsp:Transcript_46841/g.114236  ORF Transcript_46841/g.114236 Transcript_46841/m.114236 type:complete len:295 (-) Transcript_46841:1102-1986(-)
MFEADPKVRDIFVTQDGDYFGLVLVTGWRFDQELIQRPYTSRLLEKIQSCFDSEDLVVGEGLGIPSSSSLPSPSSPDKTRADDCDVDHRPAVYLYPPEHLHITVATFARPCPKKDSKYFCQNKDFNVEEFQRKYKDLIIQASHDEDWPSEPMKFVVQNVRIATKAGIILWDDITGGITKIRNCLRKASEKTGIEIEDIPNIIHTTFMRYDSVPTTPYHIVQERFESNVVPHIQQLFSSDSQPGKHTSSSSTSMTRMDDTIEFVADNIKLVSESSPYMHVDADEEHVLLSVNVKP